jgi:hypothetical protein
MSVLKEQYIPVGNLIKIHKKNKEGGWEISPFIVIQNFREEPFVNVQDNLIYYYFPFTINNFSSNSELDGLNADLSVANTTWVRNYLPNKGEDVIGAKVVFYIAFLENQYISQQPFLKKSGVVESIVFTNSVINFKIQNKLTAVDAVIPSKTFSGESFINLPYRTGDIYKGYGIG